VALADDASAGVRLNWLAERVNLAVLPAPRFDLVVSGCVAHDSRVDLSHARYTTSIDLRFIPALRGTLANVSQRWLSRTILFGLVMLFWAYAIRLLFPDVSKATASIASVLAFVVFFWVILAVLVAVVRRQGRAQYGTLPATVQVQLTETGFDVEYPSQPIRREPFEFITNWWLDQHQSQLVIVLGRKPVERCVIVVDTKALDEPTREWLLAQLRAREQ